MTTESAGGEQVPPVIVTYGTETQNPLYVVLDPSMAEGCSDPSAPSDPDVAEGPECSGGDVDLMQFDRMVADAEGIGHPPPRHSHSYELLVVQTVAQAGGGPLRGARVHPEDMPLNRDVFAAGKNNAPYIVEALTGFLIMTGIRTCADVHRMGKIGVVLANEALIRESTTRHMYLSDKDVGRLLAIVRRMTGSDVPLRPREDS